MGGFMILICKLRSLSIRKFKTVLSSITLLTPSYVKSKVVMELSDIKTKINIVNLFFIEFFIIIL